MSNISISIGRMAKLMNTLGRLLQPFLFVSILLISSSATFLLSEVSESLIEQEPGTQFTSGNQSSTPYVLPAGATSPWHNETPHFIDIEYDGNILNSINYSSLSESISEFHAIRLSLPTNNNQVIELFVEESPNQDSCRTAGGNYNNYFNMYLLRTNDRNTSNEANGYIIEYYNHLYSNWLIEGQIYGEWLNNSKINAWRLDISGNSSNNIVEILDLGISNNRGVNQSVNNTIPMNVGFYNGLENIRQLHYRLVRMTLMYELADMAEICRTVLQAENILRNQLGVQLYIERFVEILYLNLASPEDKQCDEDPLINGVIQHHESYSNLWRDSQSPYGIRGNVTVNHFDSIDTVFYYGSIYDQLIDYSEIIDNGIPKKLGCISSTVDDENNYLGFGVGWGLMDYHPSFQWNSAILFTQLVSKALGGDYFKSSNGSVGLVGSKNCQNTLDSSGMFNSILVPSIVRAQRSGMNVTTIIHESCYGIIPFFSQANSDGISSATKSAPFLHIQPDWIEHWRYRWSYFGDLRLRTWFIQSFNALENDSYFGIQGDPTPDSRSTLAGPDPIWRMRWTLERVIWSIPIWNQSSYWQNDLSFMWWYTGVRVNSNETEINMDYGWLTTCRDSIMQQFLSMGDILGYADGWSHSSNQIIGPILSRNYGTIGWGVMSCDDNTPYMHHLTEYHIPNPQMFSSLGEVNWIVFPTLQNVQIPWIQFLHTRDVEFDHIALTWSQNN